MRQAEGWGIFREKAHSPGRESDDAEILRLTAAQLEAKGLPIRLRDPEEIDGDVAERPRFVFLMCERLPILRQLAEWEAAGIPHVNSPRAVLNTYRDRMIAQLVEANVPFIESRMVATTDRPTAPFPGWVKRGDVHNTQEGDVVFAATPEAGADALRALADRGIRLAVIQPHIEGELVKFYGIGTGGQKSGPAWFRWFWHERTGRPDRRVDEPRLGRLARAGALALGLEIFGGDAIVTPAGDHVLLDLNAWPSFARFREEAARRIAEHLVLRFAAVRR